MSGGDFLGLSDMGDGVTKDLATFDDLVRHLYVDCTLSTYQIAKGLRCSQGKVAKSLKRSQTPRRTFHQAYAVRDRAA